MKPGSGRKRMGMKLRAAASFFACFLLMMQAGGLAACAQEPEIPKTRKIAVLTYSFSSEFWGYVVQGCLAWDRSDPTVDLDVECLSSSVASEEQKEMLRSDLEYDRYDGYVIAAINKEMVEEVLRDVTVPVVAIDAPFEAPCVIGSIGTDNELAASAGAKKAVDMAVDLGWESQECVMIGGVEDDYNQVSRMNGYRDGIEKAGGVWLDSVYLTDKSDEGAAAAMEQIMKDYPDGVSIIACYNDSLAEVALEKLKDNSAFENTVILGFDGNGSVCERIMNDERYANMVTVAQNPYEMGFHSVRMMSEHYAALDAEEEARMKEAAGGDADASAKGAGGKDGAAEKDAGGDADAAAKSAGGKDGAAEKDAGGQTDGDNPAGEKKDAGGQTDGDNPAGEKKDAVGQNKGDAAADPAEPETEGRVFIDSGYSVITKVNAQERMVQIRSHLS